MAVATIKDVAARAGVSVMTVSRVLNGERYVSEAKRALVLAAVEALDFRRNPSARGLPGARSYVLALVADHIAGYSGGIERGAIRRCRQEGYHLAAVAPDPEIADPAKALGRLVAGLPADGLILLPPLANNRAVLQLLTERGKPFVRVAPDDLFDLTPSVRIDEVAAAAAVMRHLMQQGHRRIGFVEGPSEHGASGRRRRGYVEALAGEGLPFEESLIRPGDFTFEAGLAAGRSLLALAEPPTAVFACNDDMALGVMSAAAQAGVAMPARLAVAGFDDIEFAREIWPPLTTIRQPTEAMGEAAAELLIARMGRGGAELPIEARLLDYELIIRGSTLAETGRGAPVDPRTTSS
ncbi:LacI family DNA-binding transcriptional regulator [Phenylobacterium montanum]|uniref:LacI family DNA-binding transcriptional regulator n=1 Tax=Phenylobacterium montanum TaxID=2823693 RepID=A0A975FYQ0_9CAUL|nr:LacI family DNA-binding transcriptional regulator [Caulobacter sp. S6]QUD87860.1 LacI family DNA-binding transcriptional regulator [Caulobacter sp. S6]